MHDVKFVAPYFEDSLLNQLVQETCCKFLYIEFFLKKN